MKCPLFSSFQMFSHWELFVPNPVNHCYNDEGLNFSETESFRRDKMHRTPYTNVRSNRYDYSALACISCHAKMSIRTHIGITRFLSFLFIKRSTQAPTNCITVPQQTLHDIPLYPIDFSLIAKFPRAVAHHFTGLQITMEEQVGHALFPLSG